MRKIQLFLLLLTLIVGIAGYALCEGDFPTLNGKGFLQEGEFVYSNETEGVWRYCSSTLKVEIIRYTDTNPKEIWYECEIWAADGELFDLTAADPENRMKVQEYPYQIARKAQSVFAVSADFAHLRISQKSRTGIIIRDGQVIASRTYPKNKKNVFPNLDTMAFYPNGELQVYYSNELKAEDYLQLGATDVISFGPMMIRDGALNTTGIKRYGTSKQPRACIGMVEAGHYFVMLVEGRHSGSKGASVQWLAEKMLARGCTTAINLDGGQSAGIIFMGKQINNIYNDYKKNISCRKASEIIAIGTSDKVLTLEDAF